MNMRLCAHSGVNFLLTPSLAIFGVSVACAQDFPNKPVRVLTGTAGGGTDFVSRYVVQAMSGSLGQPVVVENRTADISAEIVAKSPPDGHTLCVAGGTLWIEPLLRKTSYDPIRDFAPVSLLTSSPSILVVHPSVPARSVKDLIALAKAKPGELNYGSGGVGQPTHLSGELLKFLAKIDVLHVPYKGNGPAVVSLIGGETQVLIANAQSVGAVIKSGRARALAVTSSMPSAFFPGLPTVAATLPGYEWVGSAALFAPSKTPAAIVDRLNNEILRVLNRPDVKEKLLGAGVEALSSSPQELAARVKSEMARLTLVIRDANIIAE